MCKFQKNPLSFLTVVPKWGDFLPGEEFDKISEEIFTL